MQRTDDTLKFESIHEVKAIYDALDTYANDHPHTDIICEALVLLDTIYFYWCNS